MDVVVPAIGLDSVPGDFGFAIQSALMMAIDPLDLGFASVKLHLWRFGATCVAVHQETVIPRDLVLVLRVSAIVPSIRGNRLGVYLSGCSKA